MASTNFKKHFDNFIIHIALLLLISNGVFAQNSTNMGQLAHYGFQKGVISGDASISGSINTSTNTSTGLSTAATLSSLLQLAEQETQQTNYDQALLYLNQANEMNKANESNQAFQHSILNSYANIYYQTGQFEQAGRFYQQLVNNDEKNQDLEALSISLFNLAHVYAVQGRHTEVEILLNESLSVSRATDDPVNIAFSMKALGVNAQSSGDYISAENYLYDALEIFLSLNDKQQTAAVYRHLGDIKLVLNSPELAIESYHLALNDASSATYNSTLLPVYRGLSQAYEAVNDYKNSLVAYQAYSQLLIQEQLEIGQETTQRLQVAFETGQFSDENDRLSLESEHQQQKIHYQNDILDLQLTVILLSGGLILLLFIFWWRGKIYNRELLELSSLDDLTGILNRRAIMQHAKKEWERSKRTKKPFTCLIFDIDLFKQINDSKGHAEGDKILRKTAAIVKNTLRQTDSLGRIGGEEFLIISTENIPGKASTLGERIRSVVEKGLAEDKVTISVGLAELTSEASLDELVQHADQALYKAKNAGRNRVVSF